MPPTVNAHEVPQANSLDKIRAVVAARAKGARDYQQMLEQTALSPRHLAYYIGAARVLGLLEGVGWGQPTNLGDKLVNSLAGSEREMQIFREAVRHSQVLQTIAPGLLGHDEITVDSLADRIAALSGLARATAERRAETLLTWRRRLAERQLSLFDLATA